MAMLCHGGHWVHCDSWGATEPLSKHPTCSTARAAAGLWIPAVQPAGLELGNAGDKGEEIKGRAGLGAGLQEAGGTGDGGRHWFCIVQAGWQLCPMFQRSIHHPPWKGLEVTPNGCCELPIPQLTIQPSPTCKTPSPSAALKPCKE